MPTPKKPRRESVRKKIKVQPVTTWAPVWEDTMTFHLHPTLDRRTEKPPDEVHDGRSLTWIPVRVSPSPTPPERHRMASEDWFPATSKPPAPGTLVDWIAPCGKQVNGGKKGPGRLWFLPPDHQMYCYYEPIVWREHLKAKPHA